MIDLVIKKIDYDLFLKYDENVSNKLTSGE